MNRPETNNLLLTLANGEVSHFRLSEFANADGLAIVHRGLVEALEMLRSKLRERFDDDIRIRITCGTRTNEDNEALAERLGWIDEGGRVARDSKHLPKWGGVAADIVPYSTQYGPLDPEDCQPYAEQLFQFVKLYTSHLHVDLIRRSDMAIVAPTAGGGFVVLPIGDA